jgi:hypothetical protein
LPEEISGFCAFSIEKEEIHTTMAENCKALARIKFNKSW